MVPLDDSPRLTSPSDIVRRHYQRARFDRAASWLDSLEWLVTNGLGGYASGTLGGVLTRRYHALLVAALPAPLGRVVLVSRLDERVRLAGGQIGWLSRLDSDATGVATHFQLVGGLPDLDLRARGHDHREAADHAAAAEHRARDATP